MADAKWAQYTSLFRLRGSHGATSFPDFLGAASVSAVGTPSITTSVSDPFGGTFGVLQNGSTSNLTSSTTISLSGDFSIGGWFRFTNNATYQILWSIGNFAVESSSTLYLRLNAGNIELVQAGTVMCSTSAPSVNTWTHFNVSRSSGLIKLHKSGVGTATASSSTTFGTHGFAICERLGASTSTGFIGQVSEFYIANGSALYWDDFAPPASPIAAPRLSGTVKDSSGAYAAKKVRAYLRSTGNLAAEEVTSNATTGVFSIDVPTLTAHTIIFIDTSVTPENALVLDNITPV